MKSNRPHHNRFFPLPTQTRFINLSHIRPIRRRPYRSIDPPRLDFIPRESTHAASESLFTCPTTNGSLGLYIIRDYTLIALGGPGADAYKHLVGCRSVLLAMGSPFPAELRCLMFHSLSPSVVFVFCLPALAGLPARSNGYQKARCYFILDLFTVILLSDHGIIAYGWKPAGGFHNVEQPGKKHREEEPGIRSI